MNFFKVQCNHYELARDHTSTVSIVSACNRTHLWWLSMFVLDQAPSHEEQHAEVEIFVLH